MKIKKFISIILILMFIAIIFSACAKKEIEETIIGEYTDGLGITYTIYKVDTSDGETIFAKVSSVAENTRAPEIISITVPKTITYNETVYNVTIIGDMAFYKTNYDNIYIPEGVTTIEKFAFDRAKSTRIDLPITITEIGECAFLDCISLREIYLYAIIPPNLGERAFTFYDQKSSGYVNSSILTIKVPQDAKKRYNDINTYPQWEEYQGNIR